MNEVCNVVKYETELRLSGTRIFCLYNKIHQHQLFPMKHEFNFSVIFILQLFQDECIVRIVVIVIVEVDDRDTSLEKEVPDLSPPTIGRYVASHRQHSTCRYL